MYLFHLPSLLCKTLNGAASCYKHWAKIYRKSPQGIQKPESGYVYMQCWHSQNRPWRIPLPFYGLTAEPDCLPRIRSSDQNGKRQDFFLHLVYLHIDQWIWHWSWHGELAWGCLGLHVMGSLLPHMLQMSDESLLKEWMDEKLVLGWCRAYLLNPSCLQPTKWPALRS